MIATTNYDTRIMQTVRRTLRNTTHDDFTVPFPRRRYSMESSYFSVVGPTIWNELPLKIRRLPNIMPILSVACDA